MPQALEALPLIGELVQPLEQMVGGLVGDITQGMGGGQGPLSQLAQGFNQAFQGFGNLGGGLFGGTGGLGGGFFGGGISSSPMPFSGLGGNFGGGYGTNFGNIAPLSAPGGNLSGIGSSLDGMQQQANQLLQSSNPSDQLQGQQLLQQEEDTFNAISKAIQVQGEEAKTAIQAIQ
jgi:hypothetical protein